ncbi:conserved hypothetical protein [Culex quinquefasciatus]|uniref:Uncharacterized protein n=1 Tax=Culex quinquefasciatus TaxID=7176 RepID=B0X2M9_CULQU|nr:conserved hypothetical protein [Culex quinquefasciatus]|eukprot:XP_001863901.1 conserved hypothetical protein [Culex quinquefasciatus]
MYHNGPEESTPQRNRTETAMLSRTYFKWPESPCFDPMHDLLEGVVPMIIKNIFQEAVKSGKLSIDELNHRITKFDYGQVDEIKTILRAARNFEQVFHDLIYGKVPNVKKLRQMNSILNNHYFKERILNKDYPSLSEKQQLAENILKSFPQLEKTKASPDDPIEVL